MKKDIENVVDYPTHWTYKVIGTDFKMITAAIAEILADRKYKSKKSNMSSKGTYLSVQIDLVVENEDIRDSIFYSLRQHTDIKMVL